MKTSLIMTEYKDIREMTEIDFYALKCECVSFDLFNKKWFVHYFYDDYACTMNGEILLIFKRKVIKPDEATMGLYFNCCYKGDFNLMSVHDFVYQTFNKIRNYNGLVIHKNNNKLNNHIDNLKLVYN